MIAARLWEACIIVTLISLLPAALHLAALASAADPRISGELRQWHRISLTFDGPQTSETANPNPFLDYRLNVMFEKDGRRYVVPGYYAADGNAAESSATSGNKWRVDFIPDETGDWTWRASFRQGPAVAVSLDPEPGRAAAFDGAAGRFRVAPSNKSGRDHRHRGLLRYTGERYARYAGTGEAFLHVGTQSPENFLAYFEFDNTVDHGGAPVRLKDGLHRYEPHVRDWRPGDPEWRGGKGKGIIGALNYLAGKGMNTFYSLTMNHGGDGREIYPWTGYEERLRYDVSKLAQWDIVFSHMDTLGLQLMLITQEEENERLLGKLTTERKLYYRELIARFSAHHALLWDLDEEMDRWRYFKTADIEDLCRFFRALDPYRHPIQYVQWKGELLPDEAGYGRLLGFGMFDGTALQQDPANTHAETLKWVDRSEEAGHKWLVGVIEINPTSSGVLPDADDYWHDEVRKTSIWGNLMAGGSGVVFFFGVNYPNNDLDCEDWRSRDHLWDLMRHAHDFFTRHLPFAGMRHRDFLTAATNDYVLAKDGEVYAIYLPEGGAAELDLTGAAGDFSVEWYDPRRGGELQRGSVPKVTGGGRRNLGLAPSDPQADWAILVRRAAGNMAAFQPVPASYLIKLTSGVSSQSRAGDHVSGVIISPERLLTGTLEGVVEQAQQSKLRLRFERLVCRGERVPLAGTVTRLVNSHGDELTDDAGHTLRVEAGWIESAGGAVTLHEGAELRLQVTYR